MESAELSLVASGQDGLFTWTDARELGYSAWQIRARLADGRWLRVLGPVLAQAGCRVTPSVRDRAACLAAGDRAVLSGPSAARLHGFGLRSALTCVTVPRGRHIELPDVRFLREAVPVGDLVQRAGLIVTGHGRTVFDCLRLLPPDEAVTFLDRALQQDWITSDDFAARMRAHGRRHGVHHLRKLHAEVASGARSELERRAHRQLVTAGIGGWIPNHPIHDARGLIGYADLAFPAIKLVVELDGRAWHTGPDRFQRDRTRQNRLAAAGWVVLRFTWEDVTSERFVPAVRALLGGIAQSHSPIPPGKLSPPRETRGRPSRSS